MQHDLGQRHEEHGEPGDLPVIRVWCPAVIALVALAAGCGTETQQAAAPERRVLIVSGRDDHGLLAEPMVALVEEPDGGPTDQVPDGTLVAVVESRGEWALVRTVEGRAAEGWVNDFYLRGTAHLACTNEPVELLAVDGERVQVRPTGGGPDRWVARDTVAELPTDHCGDGDGDGGDGGAGGDDDGHDHGDDGHDHDH